MKTILAILIISFLIGSCKKNDTTKTADIYMAVAYHRSHAIQRMVK